ncbi:hypothetical protein MRX96_044207 [Rhipicephalus microplus]
MGFPFSCPYGIQRVKHETPAACGGTLVTHSRTRSSRMTEDQRAQFVRDAARSLPGAVTASAIESDYAKRGRPKGCRSEKAPAERGLGAGLGCQDKRPLLKAHFVRRC